MSKESFTALAEEVALLVNQGNTQKARAKLVWAAIEEYRRGYRDGDQTGKVIKAVLGWISSLRAQ